MRKDKGKGAPTIPRLAKREGTGLAVGFYTPLVSLQKKREERRVQKEGKEIDGMHPFPRFTLNSNNSKNNTQGRCEWCTMFRISQASNVQVMRIFEIKKLGFLSSS
jgi:hypothetical protein